MSVPLDATDTARLVRAHELMHARVSPLPDVVAQFLGTITAEALAAAEELRVNTLVARLGFEMEHLQDGTEVPVAATLARRQSWPEAVRLLATVMNTGSEDVVLRALRKGQPDWAKALTAIRTALRRRLDHPAEAIASTYLNGDEIPTGYANFSVPIARLLDSVVGAALPTDADQLRMFKRSLEPGGRRPRTGRFADLKWMPPGDLNDPWETRVRGRSHRRPTTDGSTLRYPERLLTDPQRRAFVRRSAAPGGVVVIDQSGSMDLDIEQVHDLVKRFPSALVIGYSHQPGSSNVPNAWVLASDGHVRPEMPSGNVGNGVDGPVLEYAISQRRSGETIVWVTDGQVTDSNDHPGEELTLAAAQLVRSGAIRLVNSVEDVPRALHPGGGQLPKAPSEFGRVGRVLEKLAQPNSSVTLAAYSGLSAFAAAPGSIAGVSAVERGGLGL